MATRIIVIRLWSYGRSIIPETLRWRKIPIGPYHHLMMGSPFNYRSIWAWWKKKVYQRPLSLFPCLAGTQLMESAFTLTQVISLRRIPSKKLFSAPITTGCECRSISLHIGLFHPDWPSGDATQIVEFTNLGLFPASCVGNILIFPLEWFFWSVFFEQMDKNMNFPFKCQIVFVQQLWNLLPGKFDDWTILD